MARKHQPAQTIIVRFPDELLKELDVLCRMNIMGRAEFIQISLRQMVEYIDRYAPHLSQLQAQAAAAEQQRQVREQEARKAAAVRAAAISPEPDSLASVPYRQGIGQSLVAAEEPPFPSRKRRGYRDA